jgi:uroporphyrinogen-III synthase
MSPATPATRPLQGLTVVVTRTRRQASSLVALLEAAGARTLEVPVIEVAGPADGGVALDAAADRLANGAYAWVAVTSPNGAERLLAALDGRGTGGAKVAAVGPATAAALTAGGLGVALVPPEAVAESLVAAMPAPDSDGGGAQRVLLPQAAVARQVLEDGLVNAGWDVDVVEAYRTVPALVDPSVRDAVAAADVVTFTSSSTVEHFCDQVSADGFPRLVASIGPITTASAVARGVRVDVEAGDHTVPGLVDALVRYVSDGPRDGDRGSTPL